MIPKLVIHTEVEKIEEYAESFIRGLGFNRSHPDLMWFDSLEKLGIEQARKIRDFLSLKPYQSERQVIVITVAQNLTIDAQNALLKTLEEHADGVNFILGVSSEDQLLPTLVSRCQIINLAITSTPDVEQNYQKDIENLLVSTTEQRFQFIEKLKEREEFLPALTAYFRYKLLEKSLGGILVPPLGWTIETLQDLLKDLIEGERWAGQNVNIRAILEYFMLKMPTIKN